MVGQKLAAISLFAPVNHVEYTVVMSPICRHCQASVLDTDKFCHSCGTRLALPGPAPQVVSPTPAVATEDIHPLPGLTAQPDLVKPRRHSKRRPWYRRKLILALAGLVALMLIGTAAGMVYVNHQFAAFNDISTPPPKVAGAVFDAAATAEVDTSSAQQVLALAKTGATGDFTLAGSDVGDKPAAGTVSKGIASITPSSMASQPAGAGEPVEALGTVPSGTSAGGAAAMPVANASNAPASFTLKSLQASNGGSLNILLMGVDARPGEAIDIGVRPDSLSVLHLDTATGSCRILGIPRDTRTELPGYGLTKINHALAVGGIPYEQLVVEQLLGITIDHYGLIDFSGIEDLVDAVGGVTVSNPKAFEIQGITFNEGEITLNGKEALAYARFRYDENGDFGRIRRQQQIIRAIMSRASGMDIARSAPKLLLALEGHTKTDLSPVALIGLANDYRSSCTSATLEVANLEGSVATYPDPLLNMDLSYVIVDQGEIDQKVKWLLGGK